MKMETQADREQMLAMAAQWDQLAEDRAYLIQKHPELGVDHDQREDAA